VCLCVHVILEIERGQRFSKSNFNMWCARTSLLLLGVLSIKWHTYRYANCCSIISKKKNNCKHS